MGQVESEQHLLTEYVLHHCKNRSVTFTPGRVIWVAASLPNNVQL